MGGFKYTSSRSSSLFYCRSRRAIIGKSFKTDSMIWLHNMHMWSEKHLCVCFFILTNTVILNKILCAIIIIYTGIMMQNRITNCFTVNHIFKDFDTYQLVPRYWDLGLVIPVPNNQLINFSDWKNFLSQGLPWKK